MVYNLETIAAAVDVPRPTLQNFINRGHFELSPAEGGRNPVWKKLSDESALALAIMAAVSKSGFPPRLLKGRCREAAAQHLKCGDALVWLTYGNAELIIDVLAIQQKLMACALRKEAA